MNPNCNKTHCPGKNDHNCSASPEICHGECTQAPSDWKKELGDIDYVACPVHGFVITCGDGIDSGSPDEFCRVCADDDSVEEDAEPELISGTEYVQSFITTLIQKKESAAREDERERCEKAVEVAGYCKCEADGDAICAAEAIKAIRSRKDV